LFIFFFFLWMKKKETRPTEGTSALGVNQKKKKSKGLTPLKKL